MRHAVDEALMSVVNNNRCLVDFCMIDSCVNTDTEALTSKTFVAPILF